MLPSIIYIVCPGHSGSTLLDMLLGVHKDIFSTGELVHLPNQYYRNKIYEVSSKNGLSCSCGKNFYDCEFWGRLINLLNKDLDYDIINNPLRFKTVFLMSHEIPHQKKYHKLKRRLFYFIVRNRITILNDLIKTFNKRQLKNNKFLNQTISELSGSSYIVDSTKDIIRLHFLLQGNINTKVIVLKRDILGVAASSKKLNVDPILAAEHWVKFYNRLNSVLKYNTIKHITINYENVVRNPLHELNQIYRYIGITELNHLPSSIIPKDYHIVAGNGLRYKEKVIIKEDNNWKERLTKSEIDRIKKIYENNFVEYISNE